jgi:threonylcarbamoyladenosine tRNA methylthiotransferase MtaB
LWFIATCQHNKRLFAYFDPPPPRRYNQIIMNSLPPKNPTIALDFLGCKLNQAENQELARRLEAAGYTIVGPGERADIYVLNTCSVTLTADRKSRHLLRQARRRNPAARLIAIGCYAQQSPKELAGIEGVELVLGNEQKMDLLRLLGGVPPAKKTGVPPARYGSGRTRAFLKIQQGCKNFCSYCIVPFLRSKESSVPVEAVLTSLKELLSEGCREVVLTGTEIGNYQDNGTNLETLIKRVLVETAQFTGVRFRLSSLQPHHITPALLALWEDVRLCPHFHLSLQSGSDSVLQRMKRKYTTGGYRKAIGHIRGALPEAGITTDVIVGFPGETDVEFEETVVFCKEMGFSRIHVFPFSPRPGTAAATMTGQVPDALKKERTGRMLDLAKESARQFFQGFLGKTTDVLWEQQSYNIWSGYTGNYIKVYCKSVGDLTNTITQVKLVKLYRDGVWGELKE